VILAACIAVAGCGDTETTVINQTTTVTSSGDVATETPAATSTTVAPTSPTPPDLAEPEGKTTAPQQYTGPCGEPGAVTGGTAGTSATNAVPGFANLETRRQPCTFATTVAKEWQGAWTTSCASGCNRRIEGMNCDYGGSGTQVHCRTADSEVTFDLVFLFE
jgi:hypothetical protein